MIAFSFKLYIHNYSFPFKIIFVFSILLTSMLCNLSDWFYSEWGWNVLGYDIIGYYRYLACSCSLNYITVKESYFRGRESYFTGNKYYPRGLER